MKEQTHLKRICVGVLCFVTLLTGCGKDPDITIQVLTPQEIISSETQESKSLNESKGQEETGQREAGREENVQMAPEQEPSAPEQEMPEQEISITISATGDVTLGNYREQDYELSFNQTYDRAEDKGYFFENVADIFAADDMTIVNLEGVFTLSEKYEEGRTYNIKGLPEYAELLSGASVEAVSMANNHRLDYGEEGTRDTIEALDGVGIAYAYDKNVGVYEVKGVKIGWVAVNEATQGVNVEKILENGIAKLREEGADLVLACCHWGTEREYYPEDYQKELGRKCIDWGADLVLGHHPHVLQGIDQYQGKYIVYSLGNFCFGANRNPSDKDTMIFQQTFTFRQAEMAAGKDGEAAGGTSEKTVGEAIGWQLQDATEARIIPCRISSVTSRNDFRPTPLTGEDGQRVIDRVNELSREFGVAADENGALYDGIE